MRWVTKWSTAALLCVAALVLTLPNAGPQSAFIGVPRVVDGDSLILDGVAIRLWGIDAPELDQECLDARGETYPCGLAARHELINLIRGQRVRCLTEETDRFGRAVATCTIADEQDLGEAMVRAGWAVDYTAYSRRAYEPAEREAREARRGMHAGGFQLPRVWRAERGNGR